MAEQAAKQLYVKLDTKKPTQISIFVSYAWKQKEKAKYFQLSMEGKGHLVIRDEENLQNGVYLPAFMQIVRHPNLNFICALISKAYLMSESCMYEVHNIMQRLDWQNTFLPYVVTSDPEQDPKIYDGIAVYMDFWKAAKEKHASDPKKSEKIDNILKILPLFAEAIQTRINVSEEVLLKSDFEVFDKMIKDQTGTTSKFQDIEASLQVALNKMSKMQYEKSEKLYSEILSKIDDLEDEKIIVDSELQGRVYRNYAVLLEEMGKMDLSARNLKIAQKFGFVGDQKAAVQPTSNVDSVILDATKLSGIHGFFGKSVNLKLVYRGTRDGSMDGSERNGCLAQKAFHAKCDSIGPNLTVVKTQRGNVFGGFTTQNWSGGSLQNGTGQSKSDNHAFVFSLAGPKGTQKFKVKKTDRAIVCYPNCGPFFGYDLAIWYSGGNCCSQDYQDKYEPHGYLDGGENEYLKVAEIEVFQVTNY